MLKNTTPNTVTGITIFTNRSLFATYKLAAVSPAFDSCNNALFEKLLDGNSLPFQADLEPAEGSGEAITIASLASSAMIGIWVERDLDLTQFTILDGNETLPFNIWNRNTYPFPSDTSIGCAGLSALLGITYDGNGNAIIPPPPNSTITYDTAQLVINWT